MMNKKWNNRGIAPLFIVLGVLLVLIVLYVILLIPIPAFTSIRTQINYFLILIFWIMLQLGIILGYYKVGTFAFRGVNNLKMKVMNWSLNIRDYIIRKT